jgi:ElaB/YqjD/DUF883 family membrane-anchored ribosome-binding protein
MRTPPNGRRVAEKAEELYETSRKMAAGELSRARAYVVENPLKAVLLGVGAGFLLASIFRPRD